jgi:hypothetical protein
MDDSSASLTPTVGHARDALEGEEEDLGFGNPKKREKPPKDDEGEESEATATTKVESAETVVPEQPSELLISPVSELACLKPPPRNQRSCVGVVA